MCRETKFYATSNSRLVVNQLSREFITKYERIIAYLKTLK